MSRIQRSPEQWRQLIQQQQAGTLAINEFCEKHNASTSNFYHWRKRLNLKDTRSAQDADDWQAIEISQPTTHASSAKAQLWDIEVSLPNGVTLRMRQ